MMLKLQLIVLKAFITQQRLLRWSNLRSTKADNICYKPYSHWAIAHPKIRLVACSCAAIDLLISHNDWSFWAPNGDWIFYFSGNDFDGRQKDFGFKSSTEIPFKRVFADEDTSMRTCRSYSFLTTKSRAYAHKAINKNIKYGWVSAPASWTTSRLV